MQILTLLSNSVGLYAQKNPLLMSGSGFLKDNYKMAIYKKVTYE